MFLCFFNSIGGFPYPDSFWVFCFFSLLKGPGRNKHKKKILTEFFRNKVKGVFRRRFSQHCAPLLAVALWVPNALLRPKPLDSFCFLGCDTGFCENPFAKTPFSRFQIFYLFWFFSVWGVSLGVFRIQCVFLCFFWAVFFFCFFSWKGRGEETEKKTDWKNKVFLFIFPVFLSARNRKIWIRKSTRPTPREKNKKTEKKQTFSVRFIFSFFQDLFSVFFSPAPSAEKMQTKNWKNWKKWKLIQKTSRSTEKTEICLSEQKGGSPLYIYAVKLKTGPRFPFL